ncbi:hypothetical protein [Tenacibaculum sp. 190524A05c]|uniref:hypothetical protein n=1 Tax=Tenacibaculum platacis TaxID=3137852 RepID=UPI0031FA64DC
MFSWNKKIQAGALQYVLVIAIIIFIILLSFVQLVQVQQRLSVKNSLYKEAILNTTNGFKFVTKSQLGDRSEISVKFSGNPKETTEIAKGSWGVFDLIKVSSKVNKEFFQKIALIGNYSKTQKAIYLTDNNTPLVVVGNTKITGTAYLPKRGIKRGNIGGNSYYGNVLVNGATRVSSSSLSLNSRLKNLNNFSASSFDSKEIQLKEGDKLVQSFNRETLIYRDYLPIKLQDISLQGNIIVQSQSKIIVSRDSELLDIILIAPEIIIESGTKATFQAIATKRIEVGSNVQLAYPSYLAVTYKSTKIEENHGVFIGENCLLKGGVCFLQKESKERNLEPQIKIDISTKVIGEVFCQGNTEILGTVHGEVSTNNFITKQLGTRYINHLYNAVINSRELPDEFVGVTGDSNKKGVAKWLY